MKNNFDNYYEKIISEAMAAAEKALWACEPTPQTFYAADIDDKPIDDVRDTDPEGDCGGAYITGLSGHEPFVKWAKRIDLVSKGTYKGYELMIPKHKFKKKYNGQSAERAEACAKAFAEVLNKHGIRCGVRTYLS